MSLFGKLLGNSPSGGGGGGGSGLTLVTETIDLTVGTKQNIGTAVGASIQQIVRARTARNANQSLAGMVGDITFGFNAGANDVQVTLPNANLIQLLTADLNDSKTVDVATLPSATGEATDQFGVVIATPTYAQQVVTLAGEVTSRGTYLHTSIDNGRPLYQKWISAGVFENELGWTGALWHIYDATFADVTYESADNVATPDLVTTWVAVNGAGATPPTVTAGASPTVDIDVLYYDAAV